MALEFNDSNFETEVLKSDKVTLVDFWAPWCGPCVAMGPTIDQLHTEMADAKIGKLNVDENPEASTNFGVSSIPTILIFKNGEVVDKIIGMAPKNILQKKIEAVS